MPRQKPTSLRQKKEEQKLKRAIKRGDAPPPEPVKKTRKRKPKRGPTGQLLAGSSRDANVDAVRKLQSSFIRIPQSYLEETRTLASTLPLQRPIPDNEAIYKDPSGSTQQTKPLTCPRRPKWRFDMTKKEVEKNEEGLFKKWIDETDKAVRAWQEHLLEARKPQPDESVDPDLPPPQSETMPPSTTYFERNLEVWRQLWRVTEISQVLLVLLDSRCPLLHFPPSLSEYLNFLGKKVILVLTKVDISGPLRVEAWKRYLQDKYPSFQIVQVESYAEVPADAEAQGKTRFQPSIPFPFREKLVQAIKAAHAELLQPPDKVKANPERLKHWKPKVKQEIDWGLVVKAEGEKVGMAVGGPALPQSERRESDEQSEASDDQEPEFLTVGLIGQPNVGKSSLLNALFGTSKVRASKTPGKTKHFQTLFWTPEVRLVDCPGLVMPNYIPMELQVLCGILPIARLPAIPACIHYAARILPLEQIYKLQHPRPPAEEDKRTWREGMKPKEVDKTPPWTGMDILTAYANEKRWVTAKAGRPDVNRAGNALLRASAEGRISWAFWPPGTEERTVSDSSDNQKIGVWIPRTLSDDDEDDSDEEEEDENTRETRAGSSDETGESEAEDDVVEGETKVLTNPISGFGALAVDDVEEEEDSDG